MFRIFKSFASCSPSTHKDSYIYKIVPCTNQTIAGITSADELFVVDGSSLQNSTVVCFLKPPSQLTSLVTTADGQGLICAGGSGDVFFYDIRSQQHVGSITAGKGVTAMNLAGNTLALGTEYVNHQAIVSTWDIRHTSAAKWQNAENHDDITALDFQPDRTNIVLAGGDDGQVSLFDTNIAEEEDSLVQGLNQGPVHKAGFLDQHNFYALSSDQNLALHPVFDDARTEEPKPVLIGDVRPLIPCEYVVDIIRTGNESTIAAGSHSKSRVDILAMKPDGTLDLENRLVLEGAHGEEIVRSLYVNDQNDVIYTAGEDGQIQAFRQSLRSESSTKKSKSKKEAGRYKPY